jgi:hypothetical protein
VPTSDRAVGAPDANALAALSALLSDAAARIDALRATIHLELRSAYWFGPQADDVRETWESALGPEMGANAERLRALAGRMLVRGT